MGDPEHERVGSVLLGRYRVESVLGRGGMSTVYRGVQLSVQRPVAIKLIAGSIARDPECVHRFRREAEAMAKLQHPSSVRIFEFGVTEQQELFIVMELLEGQDLAEHLHARGALPLTEALGIVHQTLEALCEAHVLGIVHRDLKPANIFLSQLPRAQVLVKVMDFGIAGIEQAADDTKLTKSGVVMGTPAYLSPEQALGAVVDARSDLYSLGVTLFEMLTGRPPFVADATAALLVAHVSTAPPRLSELRPGAGFWPELQAFVDGLLAKRPEDRPASAEQALAELEALLANQQLALGAYSRAGTSGALPLSPQPAAATPGQHTWPVFVAGVHRTWPVLVQRARRHRTAVVAGGALALGCGLWLLTGTAREPAPSALVRPAALPPTAAEATGSVLHEVRIVTAPSGASVQLNGVELGKTPYVLHFRSPTELSLELAGFDPQPLSVTPETEPNVAVELSPQAALPGARTPALAVRPGAGGTPRDNVRALDPSEPRQAAPPGSEQPRAAGEPIPVLRAPDATPRAGDPLSPGPVAARHSPAASRERVGEPPPRPPTVLRADDAAPATRERVGDPVLPPPSAARQPPAPRRSASVAALLASPGRPRREALLEAGPPYATFAAAKRAREGGALDNSAYRDVVWALRAQRNRRIDAEKLSYRRGVITRAEYARRERQIELEYAGK